MKKRIDYLDTAKGILIILVVIGHMMIAENHFKTWIWSFHMPAYFIITGILMNYSSFNERSFLTMLMKSIKGLIFPYIIFEVLGCIVNHLRFGNTLNAKGYIYNSLTLHYNNIVDWFLITLFFAEILVWFIIKFKNKCIFYAIIGMLYVIGLFNVQPFLCRILLASAFILTGKYASKCFTSKNQKLLIICIAASIICTIFNNRVDMLNTLYYNPVLYLIGSFAGTILIIFISQHIAKSKLLNFCGKHSLVIMGIHMPLLLALHWV